MYFFLDLYSIMYTSYIETIAAVFDSIERTEWDIDY